MIVPNSRETSAVYMYICNNTGDEGSIFNTENEGSIYAARQLGDEGMQQ